MATTQELSELAEAALAARVARKRYEEAMDRYTADLQIADGKAFEEAVKASVIETTEANRRFNALLDAYEQQKSAPHDAG